MLSKANTQPLIFALKLEDLICQLANIRWKFTLMFKGMVQLLLHDLVAAVRLITDIYCIQHNNIIDVLSAKVLSLQP